MDHSKNDRCECTEAVRCNDCTPYDVRPLALICLLLGFMAVVMVPIMIGLDIGPAPQEQIAQSE